MLKPFVLILLTTVLFCSDIAQSQIATGLTVQSSARPLVTYEAPIAEQPETPDAKLVEGKKVSFFISYYFIMLDLDATGKVIVTEQFKVINQTEETKPIHRVLSDRKIDVLEAENAKVSGINKNKIDFSVPSGAHLYSVTYRDDRLFSADDKEDLLYYRFTNTLGIPIAYIGGTVLLPQGTKVSAYRSQKEFETGAEPLSAFAKADQERNVGFFINEPLASNDSFMMASVLEKDQIHIPFQRKFMDKLPLLLAGIFLVFIIVYIRLIPRRLLNETKPFSVCAFMKAASNLTVSLHAVAFLFSSFVSKGFILVTSSSFILKGEGNTPEEKKFIHALFNGQTEFKFEHAGVPVKRLKTELELYLIRCIKRLFVKFFLPFYGFAAVLSLIFGAALIYFDPLFMFFGVAILFILIGLLFIDYHREMSGYDSVIPVLIAQNGETDIPDEDQVMHMEALLGKIDPQLAKKRALL